MKITNKVLSQTKQDGEHLKAVEQAKQNYQDIKTRGTAAIGGDVLEFLDAVLTTKKWEESEQKD